MGKFFGTIVRFIVSALVLLVVGWLVPGRNGFTGRYLLIVIAVLGALVRKLLGKRFHPRQEES